MLCEKEIREPTVLSILACFLSLQIGQINFTDHVSNKGILKFTLHSAVGIEQMIEHVLHKVQVYLNIQPAV